MKFFGLKDVSTPLALWVLKLGRLVSGQKRSLRISVLDEPETIKP